MKLLVKQINERKRDQTLRKADIFWKDNYYLKSKNVQIILYGIREVPMITMNQIISNEFDQRMVGKS